MFATEPEKALPLYQRALDIVENVLGPQHLNVAITLHGHAELYRLMGDYEKALPLYLRALDIREKVLGPQHPDVATTLNNLAGLYESMGDNEKGFCCKKSGYFTKPVKTDDTKSNSYSLKRQ
ncbi:MAG: tetratricopeptide repeat protein [Methanosarcina sp.]